MYTQLQHKNNFAQAQHQQQHYQQSQYNQAQMWHQEVQKRMHASDNIRVVPRVRSEHDGYNQYSKTPSGVLRISFSGQMIELFEGTHEGLRRDALGNAVCA